MPIADPKNLSRKEQENFETVKYPNRLEDDTIDLFEILVTVWKWKWMIIVITVIAVLGSYIYAERLPRIYKAETLLLPPKDKNFQVINLVGIKELTRHDPDSMIRTRYSANGIFSVFKQNLNSRTFQRKFVKEYGLMEFLAPDRTPQTKEVDIVRQFTGLIFFKEEKGVYSLSIELNDPEIAAQWVNDFTNFVNKETITMIVDEVQNSIENAKSEIEYSIESKRLIAEKRREDQIIRYTENASIAKALGIIKRVDATNIIQTTQMNVDINNASSPLYYLGYEALMTEINILRNRKSDDAFILGLRDLQEKLEMLSSIKLKKEKMSSVRVDLAAYPPSSPIKPDQRFIIKLASVIALFSGIILSFLIEFFLKQRQKIRNHSLP